MRPPLPSARDNPPPPARGEVVEWVGALIGDDYEEGEKMTAHDEVVINQIPPCDFCVTQGMSRPNAAGYDGKPIADLGSSCAAITLFFTALGSG